MQSATRPAVRSADPLGSCPVWCVDDHTGDAHGEHFHRSLTTFVPGGLNDGTVRVALEQLTVEDTGADGDAVIHVKADAYMTPERARALAAVLLVAAETATDRQ